MIILLVFALASVFVYFLIKEGLNHKIYDWNVKNMLMLLSIACIISTIWTFLPQIQLVIIILASSGFSYLIICHMMNRKSNAESPQRIYVNQEQGNPQIMDSKEGSIGKQQLEKHCQIIRQNKNYTKEEFVREVNNQNISISTSLLERLNDKDSNNSI
ncbi:MAG: hypothetical protein K0Q53_1263 [Massilibacillus sp.]|nr:hypothetical protein [Massilibacillus sp.]